MQDFYNSNVTFLAVLRCEIWEMSQPDAPGDSVARKWDVGGDRGPLRWRKADVWARVVSAGVDLLFQSCRIPLC